MNVPGVVLASQKDGSPQSDVSQHATRDSFIIAPDDKILVTGAAGFIGSHVVESLVDHGFHNLVCFVRPSSELVRIRAIVKRRDPKAQIEVLKGNLLSRADCEVACKDVKVIFHLAAGTGEKSFPDAFMNSVVTTRNLLEASMRFARLQRFVLVSSFSVYTNRQNSRFLDESCPVEQHPELRGDAYCYAKVKQEKCVTEYGENFGIPYVVVRPGSVYGEGNSEVPGRVGIGTFGVFLHLGGSNKIPFTYVENCAEAIVLAGLVKGVDREVFNVIDDDIPSSRQFLREYKNKVRRFTSIYVPHVVSYAMCYLWEKYSRWSKGQLPLAFSCSRWHAYWKETRYSNEKIKLRLGWVPRVSTEQGLNRYFAACGQSERNA